MSTGSDPVLNVTVSRRAIRRASLGLAVVAVLVAAAVIIAAVVSTLSSGDTLAAQVNSRDYQAVFLTSNEVYFGKLSVPGGSFCYLRHVYRLTALPSTHRGQPLQRTLVKLVNDVQSPQDLLIINKSQILYVENLNPSGKAARLLASGGP